MVFCYKIITESPRRSRCASPRKRSPVRRSSLPNTISELISSFDYVNNEEVWGSIPERDWKLLEALARKREEKDERERLAEQFQKMWLKEKEERQMVEAETSEQYKRFLHQKRSREQSYNEFKRLQRSIEQQLKRGQLMDCIRHKEQRSAELLAWREDRKITDLIGKAVEEEARIQLAKDRRCRLGAADEWKKQVELVYTLKKVDDASKRRDAFLRNASQRLAISNALSSWETSLIRQDLAAAEALQRAQAQARGEAARARTLRARRARGRRLLRARRAAALAREMRDAVRGTR
ncbi:unnamed protein product, partial [Brenthis ino]